MGEASRGRDIPINVCRKKHLTNVRASRGDMEIRLTPPRQMSLDEAVEYLADDELLEVTPQSYRIRKRILNTDERGKQSKKIQGSPRGVAGRQCNHKAEAERASAFFVLRTWRLAQQEKPGVLSGADSPASLYARML